MNLQKLFVSPVRYEIPLFQRSYVWGLEKQWSPLWEDVQNTAERYLNSEEKAHFLGAVVLQQKPVSTPMLQTRLVVDGQQRLTTLQLLLDAVQEVLEQHGVDTAAKRLKLLVLNPEAYRDDKDDNAFKVWPTTADQGAFRNAMHNDLPSEEYEESLIVQAHNFFKYQVSQWLDMYPQENVSQTQAREALEKAVSQLLQLVVIDLDPSDDPHVIFETLNARGTPLLQSDLIKNMVLFEAGKAGVTSNSAETDPFRDFKDDDDDWWSDDIQQGRLVRPRIDVFLSYWLVMRTRKEVVAHEVFSEFRCYYKKQNKPIENIAADISRVGKLYRALEEKSNPDMETFLYRWEVMQAGTMTPVLLWMLSSEVPREQMDKGLRALESHYLRRMVCRRTTRGYNRLFISLVERLEEAGAEYAGDKIVDFLRKQDSDVGLWPSDREIEEAFLNLPLYRLLTRKRLCMILEAIEEELRTDKAESQSVPHRLTIEHTMPRRWRTHWPLVAGVENEAEQVESRDQLIHTIGNLTLVTNRLNAALSNAPWKDKRETLSNHSTLFLNKDLLDNAPEVWDESAIEERAKRICLMATKVWPHADSI